ncbi:MAG: PBP1A family penicillin-binding protein [Candidatus Hydrogenedentes bacterium]|nr:PBP1A family penicillin-binding protein [Candidatus Hydrogenedentota bacterium]
MPDTQKSQAFHRGCGALFFLIMLVAGAVWGAGLGVFVKVLEDAKTVIAILDEFRPKIGSKVYSWDGELLGEFSEEQRQLVRLTDIPLHLQKAFLATEDDIFYQHKGVRPDAIINSLLFYFQTGRARGASTITMQVVRNVEPLEIGQEVTLERKIREAIVALQVERHFTKDEILELYLNQIFLGISAYGVEAASHQYFNKSCRDTTLAEAAVLAGITRAPNSQNPFANRDAALTRRGVVLGQMLGNGFITPAEYEAAMQADMDASVVTPEERAELASRGEGVWKPNRFKAAYFCEEVRRFLLAQTEKDEVFGEGLEVHTTIDMRLQRAAEEVLLAGLGAFDQQRLEQLTRQGKADEFQPVSGALVCIDNREPYRGFVRAMVGGRDFEQQKYNTVTQARRQPGSSIKPFVWAVAISKGLTPSTIMVDEPFVRYDGAGKPWAPQNFGGTFEGPVTLRRAIEKSVNIISIKLVERFGMPEVRAMLRRCGITTPIDDVAGLTVGLGTPDVLVLDHCTAYSCFANEGVRYDPVMVAEIRNRDGLTRYDYHSDQRVERALPANVAYVMTYLMQGAAEYGTGSRSKALGRPRAGKTGTTNENRNVWFCGFTPDFTCVVWMGYRDNSPLGRGRDYTGGRLACPIWTEFMIRAHEGLPVRDFDVPDGVQFINVERESGVRGGRWREAFITGTEPPAAVAVYDQENLDETAAALLTPL